MACQHAGRGVAGQCLRPLHPCCRPASGAARSEFHWRGPRGADAQGYYRFVTIKPGAYPWGNHHNAWRPAHIHFSVFGHSFVSRLVTQMYFPGDPLFPFDPIFNSVTDEKARVRMVSTFDLENTKPEWALCYRFNIVLRGRNATPMETK